MGQVLKMRWEGVTPEQYEALRPIVRWEAEPPDGLIFHVAWFRDGGITVLDVWESSAHFDDFMQERLGPGAQQIGMRGQPETKWFDAHAYFIPGVHAATPV
jgi:hypothetical protein